MPTNPKLMLQICRKLGLDWQERSGVSEQDVFVKKVLGESRGVLFYFVSCRQSKPLAAQTNGLAMRAKANRVPPRKERSRI